MTLGLGTRLAFFISTLLLFLVISAGVIIDRQLTRAIHEEGQQQAEAYAQTMMVTLQTLMLSGQATLVHDWMERMRRQQDVLDINIFRADGVEAFTDLSTIQAVNNYLGWPRFSREPLSAAMVAAPSEELFTQALQGQISSSRNSQSLLTFYVPIKVYPQCLECHGYDTSDLRGVMMVVQSTLVIDQRIRTMRQGLWQIAIFLVVVLGSVLWIVLRYKVLRPVLQLQEAIAKVGEGDRQARLPVHRNDELGAVSQVFNQMQEQLQSSEARIRAVTDNVADGIITMDAAGVIVSANPAVTTIFAFTLDELIGNNISLLMPSLNIDNHNISLGSDDKSRNLPLLGRRQELIGQHKKGHEVPVDIMLSEMIDGDQFFYIGIIRDVTERKQQMEALQYQALHDSLTGLPNRNLLADRVQQALRSAQRQSRPLALLLADLDRFKEINDTLGHHNGDRVLQQVAEHLKQVVRSSDTVARLGGDEFAILLPAAELIDAINICHKLLARMEQTIELEGHSFEVGISIGIAMYPEHGANETALMQRADVAMYAAKRSHSGYMVYDESQSQHSVETLSLVSELRMALDKGQLLLHYQPVVDLQTGTLSAVEALVRWDHPRLGLLQPDDFLPVAEKTGLIRPLMYWVLTTAHVQSQRWLEQGLDLRISMNLSVQNLHDADFSQKFLDLIKEDKAMEPGLSVEITETALMSSSSAALEVLNRLSASGIRILIDDFGAGYSSLNYLKRLPIDEIKIDRSFVTHMAIDESDTVIVRSTIDLAHNMGFKVVAEGVEDEATYQLLERLHCDLAQGFHICRPLPAQQLVDWLQASRWKLKKD